MTRRILETVLKHGAVLAEPGEFTKRAFLNGRIDLSRAEAVMDLIEAENQYAAESALQQLRGSVAEQVQKYRDVLLDEMAFLESALDDPEHFELDGFGEQLSEKVKEVQSQIQQLLDTAENGRVLTEGIRTVILGRPNAGKSSLLNQLSGAERAIVTEIEGTTRDLLEEKVRLGEITFLLTDTAGLRESDNVVEQIGISRAVEASRQADLLLYVVDASQSFVPLDEETEKLFAEKCTVLIRNKTDLKEVVSEAQLQERYPALPLCSISAKDGTGLRNLEQLLKELFFQGKVDLNNQILISNLRQKEALQEAADSLAMVQRSIEDGMPEDFYSVDLMDAYTSLGKIIGASVEDDLVDRIFAKFCMGK